MLAFLYWQETYTEIAGMQRFGAFYMDYLYTVEHSRGKGMGSLAFALTSAEAAENKGPWQTVFCYITFIFRYLGVKGLILVL